MRILLVLLFFTMTGLPAHAADWQLVYSIDAKGQHKGDKDALLAAVRSGQDVRVGWGMGRKLKDGSLWSIEHVADAKFLTIHMGDVYAQIDAIVPQRPIRGEEKAVIFNRLSGEKWHAILDTLGTMHSFMTGAEKPSTMKIATFWYIQSPDKGLPSPKALY